MRSKTFATALLVSLLVLMTTSSTLAVQVSLTTDNQATTNYLGLPLGKVFDPTPADSGGLGLAAPAVGSVSDTLPFEYPGPPPNPTPIQVYGDAVSSITNVGGTFQIDLTVTNFRFDQPPSNAIPTDEYVYLNVWEKFTGLPAAPAWATTGNASVNGTAMAAGTNQSFTVEPIVIVWDPIAAAWDNASFFFGAGGGGNPAPVVIASSTPVFPLGPFISGGELMIGFQTILRLEDQGGNGGVFIDLPTSLDLSVGLTPVPEPTTLAYLAMGLLTGSLARRSRSR